MRTAHGALREAVAIAAAIGLLCVGSGSSRAHVGYEGTPTFSFYAGWVERPSGTKPGKLVVVWNGLYADTASGWARLSLPAGVALVRGDTVMIGRPHGEGLRWEVSVTCVNAGPHYIRGAMWVDDHNLHIDEAEFDLKCSNVPDSMTADYSVERRAECVISGQRYRYAGMFRVPIDGPEYVVQNDIEELGSRPSLDSFGEIADQKLSTAVDTVTCVVFIRPDGSIRNIRTLSGRVSDAHLTSLLNDGIRAHWRFRPARLNGIAYDDWLLVRVPLRKK